jgi:hypothetical protein
VPEFIHGLLSHGAKIDIDLKRYFSIEINLQGTVEIDSHRCPRYRYEHRQIYVNGPS